MLEAFEIGFSIVQIPAELSISPTGRSTVTGHM